MNNDQDLNLEEGSAEVTLQDVYVMFYLMLKQSQHLIPGSRVAFDLRVFKTLPKNISINFMQEGGKLLAWVPEKPKDRKKKSKLILPEHTIITPN